MGIVSSGRYPENNGENCGIQPIYRKHHNCGGLNWTSGREEGVKKIIELMNWY